MKKHSKFVIFMVVFIDLLGFGIIIPIIPTYATIIFHAPEFEIFILIASFSAAQFLFGPIWGRFSDEFGRKPIILISLSANVIAYLLFAFAGSMTMLFISRIFAGICAGNISAAQAYMADISSPKERAKSMGLIGMAFSLGFVVGPLLGGLLSKYGYAVPGFFAAGLSLFAFIYAYFQLVESLDKTKLKIQEKRKFNFSNLIDAVRHPNIGILLIMFFILMTVTSSVYSTITIFFFKNFGFSDQTNGLALGYIGFISAIVQGTIGTVTKKFTEKKVLILGTIIAVFGISLIPTATTFLMLLGILTFYSIGLGWSQTLIPTIISQFIEPEEQGGTLGINQALGALGRVFGPVLGGFFFETFGHTFPFIIGGGIMIIIFFMSFFIKENILFKTEGA
jgi:MFS transporter, DHA1 family, tetracycline resistance protein